MDDNTTSPSNVTPPAARTAEALRELQDRAQAALTARRTRMGELEAQLTEQLDMIAGALAEQSSSRPENAGETEQSSGEADELRRELDSAKAAWNAEHERLAADVAEQVRLLDQRHAELDAQEAQLAGRRSEVEAQAAQLTSGRTDLESRQQVLDERAAELNHLDRELRQRQELLDSYEAQFATQQSQITDAESKLQRERESLAAGQIEVRASESLVEHQRNELTDREQACERNEIALTAERASLATEREAFAAEREAFAAQQQAFAAQQAAAANAPQSGGDDLADRLAKAESDLANERASWEKEFAAVRAESRKLETERDDLTSAMAAARAELKSSRVDTGAADERNELRQKFELALEDVQRLRTRVAELEQELASRPAGDQTDSVELVQLRSERDALAERVTELEKKSAAPVDDDQERADLQRRFELAVDDVRDLKKKNSQLEAQLAEGLARPGAPAAVADRGNSSWELMKKQMLADLEDETGGGGALDAAREKELATIESTIAITDEVVANKDREITELKSQLSQGSGHAVAAAEQEKVRELVDADEIIRQHRERIAKLEQEMEDKLRAAELEISVERAKIARDQSHLADLKAELDSQRAQGGGTSTNVPGQPPKRRWMSKLGLGGEGE